MQKRDELLARIGSQRTQVAAIGRQWRAPLEVADKGIAVIRFLRANPVWLVAGSAAVFLVRRRSLIGMAQAGWRLWKIYRSAGSWAATITRPGNHPPAA